jgi:intraflagellar transport protein 46
MDLSEESESSVDTNPSPRPVGKQQAKPAPAQAASGKSEESSSEEDSGDEESQSKDEEAKASSGESAPAQGAYNPEDMAHLKVSAEVRELFQYIQRYKPHDVELDTSLKCFIPDYIPSVGQIDAFLKVPRPDGVTADLGLKVLDEPAAIQSDSTVLELQMRAISKKQHGEASVRSIDDAAKNPKDIQRWIDSINDLHRSKPPMQVNYTKTMPDIEPLMQVRLPLDPQWHPHSGTPTLAPPQWHVFDRLFVAVAVCRRFGRRISKKCSAISTCPVPIWKCRSKNMHG